MAQRTYRKTAVLLISGACLGVSAWLWFSPPRPAAKAQVQAVDPETRKRTQESLWAGCPTIALNARSRSEVESWAHAGAAKTDSDIPPELRDAFVQTLTRQIMARASSDPDEYVRLASVERTSWLPPDANSAWRPIDERYRFLTGHSPDRSKAGEVLRTLVACHPKASCPRWKGIAATGAGVRIQFGRVRSPDEARTPMISGVEAIGFWFGAPAFNAYRLRKPPRTIDQVASAGRGVYVAEARYVVVHMDDTRSAWHTSWYWDPANAVWCNREMSMYSWNIQPTYY